MFGSNLAISLYVSTSVFVGLKVGPSNPFKTQQQAAKKNMLAGYVEDAHFNHFQFENQRRTFNSYGRQGYRTRNNFVFPLISSGSVRKKCEQSYINLHSLVGTALEQEVILFSPQYCRFSSKEMGLE